MSKNNNKAHNSIVLNRVYAPFTLEQISALNAYQQAGYVHPFTCGTTNPDCRADLVATASGWICPMGCGYTQDWCYVGMDQWIPINPLETLVNKQLNPPIIQVTQEVKVLDHGYVKLIDHVGDDLTPLRAARMSTGNDTGVDHVKDHATRDYLWRHEHATPFEMCDITFELQMPIFVARQFMRHRAGSINEFSGRYSVMPDLFYTPDPERVKPQSKINKQGSGPITDSFSENVRNTFVQEIKLEQQTLRQSYETYIESGIANELSRINLPVSQYTKFWYKANLRMWFHLLKLRLDSHAQYEIRVYAEAIAEIIKNLYPKTWIVFEEHTLDAVKFSKTELDLVRTLFKNLLTAQAEIDSPTPSDIHKGINTSRVLEGNISWFETRLGKSKAREFLEKLGYNN